VYNNFPCFSIDGKPMQFVTEFKYLDHVITCSLSDDKDLQREMRNMYIRTNTLLCRFGKCSKKVKVRLFRSYCLCLYGTALWNTYKVNCMKKLRSCYHRCIKTFFGYDRLYSVTAILLDLQLPSFETLLYNYKYSFYMQFLCSDNAVVKCFVRIGL